MKLTLEKRDIETDEVVIKYREMTDEIDTLIKFIEHQSNIIMVTKDGVQIVINPKEVIYLESVDGSTYLYTKDEVYKTNLSLALAEATYAGNGYFRCSKSMVLNISHISKLKSEPGNRIDAMMNNGEHVIISRRYAKELRSILRGDKDE